MPFVDEMRTGALDCGWDNEQADGTATEEQDEVLSGDESDVSTRTEMCAQAVGSLHLELFRRAQGDAFDYRGDGDVEPVWRVVLPRSTVAVFFLFTDADGMEACRRVLWNTLAVSATVWLSHSTLGRPRVPGRWSEHDVPSFAMLLELDPLLSGEYTSLQLETELENLLGCPRSRLGRMNPILGRAVQVSYELVSEDAREQWLYDRRYVLDCCVEMYRDCSDYVGEMYG